MSTFCFDSNEVNVEQEIRKMNISPARFPAKKRRREPGDPLSEQIEVSAQDLDSLNEEMMERLESIKNLKDDFFQKTGPGEEDLLESSFTLIINKKGEAGSPGGESRESADSGAPGHFECVNGEATEEDFEDFLQVKPVPVLQNGSLVANKNDMLSAIKEMSENSDLSQLKSQERQVSRAGKSEKREPEMERQLKEIEELNLLQVKDSFETAEEEDHVDSNSFESGGPPEEKVSSRDAEVGDAPKFLEDADPLGGRQRQRKSEFEYFCSERAKRFTQGLQSKLRRFSLRPARRPRDKARQRLKSIRQSAHLEIRQLIKKARHSNQENRDRGNNQGRLNEDYRAVDLYKRKSKRLVVQIGHKISGELVPGSEPFEAIQKEVDRFYADIISKNLRQMRTLPNP